MEQLSSISTIEELRSQQILYRPGQKISKIYFPTTAVLCMLTVMEEGGSIESATVGSEGASWISASLGSATMPCQTMVSVGGEAYVLAAKLVEQENKRNGVFHNILVEYSHALMISILRTGACNAIHSTKQHCIRWMLTTLDRTSVDRFSITQEFLASLLGCGRPTLTILLGELESSGAIAVERGRIIILDRDCLKKHGCECYTVIRDTFQHFRSL